MTDNLQVPISVLILTYDEEVNIGNCLTALQWCDDIVVLDSFSQDATEKIVAKSKARFYQRKFDDYAKQRNYGMNEISYQHPWLLMVDADETTPGDLVAEMQRVVASNNKVSLYRMRRQDHFMGKWIKHSSGYPTWFGRLMRVGEVRVERAINEEYVTEGEVGFLEAHLMHYPFNKGFSSWLEKHNRYSSMEAQAMLNGKGSSSLNLHQAFSKDPSVRRKFIKALIYKLPGRPLIVFFLLYFIKGGGLDGTAGLRFCLLRSIYEYMIDCKLAELERRIKKLPL